MSCTPTLCREVYSSLQGKEECVYTDSNYGTLLRAVMLHCSICNKNHQMFAWHQLGIVCQVVYIDVRVYENLDLHKNEEIKCLSDRLIIKPQNTTTQKLYSGTAFNSSIPQFTSNLVHHDIHKQ